MQKIEYDLPIFNDDDIANLNEYSNLMAKAIKGQIDKFGNPLVFKGKVQTLEELNVLTNIKSGEIYRVDNENKNYIYNGTEWVVYSDNIDLSEYQDEINEQLTTIEQEGIIVSPTEPKENRRKVWMQNVDNNKKIHVLNDNNIYEEFMKKEEKKILYNNSNGSNENITLSDSAENYDRLKIYYYNNDGVKSSIELEKPNNTTPALIASTPVNNAIYYKYARFNISNTTMSLLRFGEVTMGTTNTFDNSVNKIYVTKVVGYKD